eukprot:COSAG05_NODE_12567_length_463_cov_0.593407_1_plen_59_part_10
MAAKALAGNFIHGMQLKVEIGGRYEMQTSPGMGGPDPEPEPEPEQRRRRGDGSDEEEEL